jgi:hypothetical protein
VFGQMRVQEIIALNDDPPLLQDYLGRYPRWRFLAQICTSEVIIGTEGTSIHLDCPVPGEILQRLTYRPRRGPRPVRHVSEDGRLLSPISVHGIYRLAESSAADLHAVLTGPRPASHRPDARRPPARTRKPRSPFLNSGQSTPSADRCAADASGARADCSLPFIPAETAIAASVLRRPAPFSLVRR